MAGKRAAPRAQRRSPQKAPGRGRYDRGLNRRERAEEQRQRLLEAATAVFAEHGFGRANVEHIVRLAGMSRRTFYEHFDGLEDVLSQVHGIIARRAFAFVEAPVRAEEDPLAKVRVGVGLYFQAVAENGALARVVFREARLVGGDFEARREREFMRYVGLLLEALRAAHAQGTLSKPPDELTVFALLSGAEAVAMRAVERGEERRLPESAPAIADLFLRAFT